MPSDITLTSALQNNLQSLQKSKGAASVRNTEQIDGNTSVQNAICTAAQDFCTQSLSNRASELTQLLENLSQSIKTLEKANNSIGEITSVIKDAEALALKAQKSTDPAGFEQELGAIEDRISAAVSKAQSAGVNLLAGDSLKTAFGNNERNAIITEGLDLSPEGFGFDEISFATPSSITASIEIIRSAMDDTQSLRLTVASDLIDIQTRQDFTQQTIGSLEDGKNNINITALSEEGANLLALQTRMALSTTSFSLASPTQEDVLRLF
jgi:flagellin-like hook-associated protein FlgL